MHSKNVLCFLLLHMCSFSYRGNCRNSTRLPSNSISLDETTFMSHFLQTNYMFIYELISFTDIYWLWIINQLYGRQKWLISNTKTLILPNIFACFRIGEVCLKSSTSLGKYKTVLVMRPHHLSDQKDINKTYFVIQCIPSFHLNYAIFIKLATLCNYTCAFVIFFYFLISRESVITLIWF